MARLHKLLSIICFAASTVCWSTNQLYATRFPGVSWDDTQWRIINTVLDQGHYQSRISLANGYFGINLASAGPFMDFDVPVNGDNINGWPLFDSRQSFATIAGFFDSQPQTNGFVNGTNFPWLYQYGGESVISGIPHFGGLLLEVNGNLLNATVDPSQVTGFESILNIGEASMTWAYEWTPPASGGVTLNVRYQMFLHKLNVNQAAVQLTVVPSSDVNVTVVDVLDGDCAVRTAFVDKAFDANTTSIYSAVSPNGLPSVKAYVYSVLDASNPAWLKSATQATNGPFLGSNESSIAQQFVAPLSANINYTFTKYIGVASTDTFPDAQNTAKAAAFNASQTGWSSLLATHAQEWQSILPKDSVDRFEDPNTGLLPNDTNILELQIMAITNPFYLMQNTIGANALTALGNNSDLYGGHSISVSGLGADSYAGLVFWDADVWMAPGLTMSHPDAARQIVSYRARMLPQAMKNVGEAFTSSLNKTGRFSEGGAVYPWTSSRFGNCTGSGKFH
jgi:trehalose/maltose hydrolase-like predicted phosphorylase